MYATERLFRSRGLQKSVFMSMTVSDESYLNKRMTHVSYSELTWLLLAIVAYRVAAKISHWLKVHS